MRSLRKNEAFYNSIGNTQCTFSWFLIEFWFDSSHYLIMPKYHDYLWLYNTCTYIYMKKRKPRDQFWLIPYILFSFWMMYVVSVMLKTKYQVHVFDKWLKLEVLTPREIVSKFNICFSNFFFSEFDTDASYALTVYNDDPSYDVNISAAIYYSTCQFFDTSANTWDTNGCSPTDESIEKYAVCECEHLTPFGGGMLAPPNTLSFADLVVSFKTFNEFYSMRVQS